MSFHHGSVRARLKQVQVLKAVETRDTQVVESVLFGCGVMFKLTWRIACRYINPSSGVRRYPHTLQSGTRTLARTPARTRKRERTRMRSLLNTAHCVCTAHCLLMRTAHASIQAHHIPPPVLTLL